MKICSYVQTVYGKQTYAKECYDVRGWVGISVIEDCLKRDGYSVSKAGIATVHDFDIVLVYITSDCDWWSFIAERLRWRGGKYKVIVGGPGVLNVRPFLEFADVFVLGRGENIIVPLIEAIQSGEPLQSKNVIYASSFDKNKKYAIAQVDVPYCRSVTLENGKEWHEGSIGCPNKCFFCGYTWHRKHVGGDTFDTHDQNIIGMNKGVERAIIDVVSNPGSVDFTKLRVTAMDGFSERIRRSVNKHISNSDILTIWRLLNDNGKPHQVKMFNIVGYPTETCDDWREFLDLLKAFDCDLPKSEKQWSLLIHNTPFRATPATPMACMPMSYKNYRGEIARILGNGRYKGNIIYQGNKFWAVESMATDSLSTVFLSAIAIRGTESDAEAIKKICQSKKFWSADSKTKQATLEYYFDKERLFGEFTSETLPTAYLESHAPIKYVSSK